MLIETLCEQTWCSRTTIKSDGLECILRGQMDWRCGNERERPKNLLIVPSTPEVIGREHSFKQTVIKQTLAWHEQNHKSDSQLSRANIVTVVSSNEYQLKCRCHTHRYETNCAWNIEVFHGIWSERLITNESVTWAKKLTNGEMSSNHQKPAHLKGRFSACICIRDNRVLKTSKHKTPPSPQASRF